MSESYCVCARRQAGITRREVIWGLVIVAVLAIYVSSLVKHRAEEAMHHHAAADLERISLALHQYKLDNLRYPSAEQGLSALLQPPQTPPLAPNWAGPYLSRANLLEDPWQRPYRYNSSDAPPSFELTSFGSDGEAGGSGIDRDVLLRFKSDADY